MSPGAFRWLLLALLFASTAINYVDRLALAVLLPQLRDALSLTSFAYGKVMTVFLVAYAISQPLSGILIDRVGVRIGFTFAVLLWSVAAVFHALVTGPWTLGLARFVLGVGEGGNWPAGIKAIAERVPRQSRAFAMGIFDGGSAVGAIVAPPLVAWLSLAYGWRAAFVVTGILGLVWLACWLVLYRQLPHSESNRPTPVVPAAALLRSRAIWGLFVTRFFATPVWWFYVFWLPDYLSAERGFTLREIGLFGWIPYLAVDIGKLVGGGWSDRMLARGFGAGASRKSVMLSGAILMMAGLLVVRASTAAETLAWVSLATFGFGVWSPNVFALHSDLFPAGAVARATGFTGVGTSLGGAAFTFLTGWVVQHHGYAPAFLMAGLAAPVACLFLLFGVGPVRSWSATPEECQA